ncbi:MAG: hypothetical protein HS104_09185 [Polyangiaceae bacterium]|nr:hypothetical protein [Polyangiaceae bacterium]MCE7888581.1 hypothetical protein [Sorangiineae bacterium PRO1]MCL4754121.1 hypothetical protein [Myxococcales bacterium]
MDFDHRGHSRAAGTSPARLLVRLMMLVLCAMLLSRVAVAQSADAGRADALFREGRALMKKNDFEPACQKFSESQRLDPAAGTLVNLSECMEERGRLADAIRALRDALTLLKAGDDRIPKVRQQIATLSGRVPRLILRVPPDSLTGTKVFVDGVEYDAESLGASIEVNPGEHVVELAVPGKPRQRRGVDVKEGQELDVAAGDAEKKPVEPSGRKPPYRTLGYVLGGVGLIALALGTGSYLEFRDTESEREGICPSEQNCTKEEIAQDARLEQDADAVGRLAAIEIGTGLVAVGAGVFLLVYTPSGGDKRRVGSVRVAPVVGRSNLSAVLEGTW